MKKILSTLTIFAFVSAMAVSAAESRLETFVNQKISPLTQKEKEINSKIEAQKKADAAKRAEFEKKQKEQKAAAEAKRKEAQARHEANKKAVEKEVNAWKNFLNN